MNKTRDLKSPFSVSSADDSPGFLLWQVTTLWQRVMRAALKPYDLTHVQFVLLASLGWLGRTEKSVTQVMLARHAKLDVMMTSQVLRTLEKKCLLTRKPHPVDPRANALNLTRRGYGIFVNALRAVEQADKKFFASKSAQMSAMNALLRSLIAANAN
jgi:DNA-binding MarR family transcriptional regulator